MIRAGARLPIDAEGRRLARGLMMSAPERLAEMIDEFDMDGLDPLAESSAHRSREAELAAVGPAAGRLLARRGGSTATMRRSRCRPRSRIVDGGPRRLRRHLSGGRVRHQRDARLHHRLHRVGLRCIVGAEIRSRDGSQARFVSRAARCILNAEPGPVCSRRTSSGRCCPTWSSAACWRALPVAYRWRALVLPVEPPPAQRVPGRLQRRFPGRHGGHQRWRHQRAPTDGYQRPPIQRSTQPAGRNRRSRTPLIFSKGRLQPNS